jgi:hypothetical protein
MSGKVTDEFALEACGMSEPWRDPLARLQADDDLMVELMESEHPDARRFVRWLTHDLLPAIDPMGLRGLPGAGEYVWPDTQEAFEAMLAAAVNAVRPVQ